MSTFDAANYYFSGQGVVMIGLRNSVTGLPTGLRPIGNVSDLKISIATTVVDHKGSQDGQRAIDARLQTETKATCSITVDNWNSANLAKALRGDTETIQAGTVTAEAFTASLGMVSGFKYINISNLVVKQDTTALTAYSAPNVPWDYKENDAAGSILLNDGTEDGGVDSLATDSTGQLTLTGADVAADGSTTYLGTITGGASNGLAGVNYTVTGFVGDYVVNNGTYLCTASTDSTLVLNNPAGLAVSAAAITSPAETTQTFALSAAYSYGAQFVVNSLTQPLTDAWLRFEGLNTTDSNSPVVVDIYRFSTDPLKELALISDTFGQMVLEGAALKDFTKSAGSSYFTVKKIDS